MTREVPAVFGSVFYPEMPVIAFEDGAWQNVRWQSSAEMPFPPGAHALHYGSECFEGLKAFRQRDDAVVLFRPDDNIARMRQSARLLDMPVPEAAPFREALFELVRRAALLKLQMVGLKPGDAHKMPAELSGGMIKRVALARALIMDPPLLMLDEPTAGLDPDSSDAFCALLQSLHQELGLTVVMVTHDLDTLFALSSRVAVLAEQRVIIAAPVAEVLAFDHPFIRHFFLGERGLRAISDLPQLAHLAARLAPPAAPSSGA